MNRRERERQRKRKERSERLKRAKHSQRQASAETAHHGSEDGTDAFEVPAHSPFAMERSLRAMSRAMAGHEFGDRSEMQAFLDSTFVGRKTPDVDPLDETLDPCERAQELAYRSMETTNRARALRCAHQALEIDPACVDALTVLACVEAEGTEARIAALDRALNLGERALGGPAFFEENLGHFWGRVLTRPYMRTRQALADFLLRAGRVREAAAHYQSMLDLNPNDNQGVRYVLLGAYLELGELEATRRVLDQFPDDTFAATRWSRVLERWLAHDRRRAAKLLRSARLQNAHVEDALLGGHVVKEQSDGWTPGQPSEAAVVVDCIGRAWRKQAGAMEWLAQGGTVSTQAERIAAVRSYPLPVSVLLVRGEVQDSFDWSDYADLQLDVEHVPELVRMACDDALHEFDLESRVLWAPLHAWRALARLGPTEAIGPLTGLLRERADDNWVAEEVPRVLARLGPAAFEPLRELMCDDSADAGTRVCAATGLDGMVQTYAELQKPFSDVLRSQLARFATAPPELNGCIIEQLVELAKDPRDLPLMERAFESGRVDESWADLEGVRAALGGETSSRVE